MKIIDVYIKGRTTEYDVVIRSLINRFYERVYNKMILRNSDVAGVFETPAYIHGFTTYLSNKEKIETESDKYISVQEKCELNCDLHMVFVEYVDSMDKSSMFAKNSNIEGALAYYRKLSDMDGQQLSMFDNLSLEDADYVLIN